ncbi:MAG: hypothetical protein AB1Z19_07930 [Eubacteriales bacterium]
MKQKIFVAFSAVTLLVLLSCVGIYIFLETNLVPTLEVPTPVMITMTKYIALALLISAIYHIALLVRKLKTLNGRFFDAVFTVMIILSGITLLSDVTLLGDIGKEYQQFDVSSEWLILYAMTAFQIITVTIGLVVLVKTSNVDEKLFNVSGQRQENIFLSMHHLALVCGLVGVAGIAIPLVGLIMPINYSAMKMGVLSVLVICPLVLIVLYWLISMKKSRAGEWTDEKQKADTGAAAVVALMIFLVVMVTGLIFGDRIGASLPVSFWMLTEFFLMLIGFSTVIVVRNR